MLKQTVAARAQAATAIERLSRIVSTAPVVSGTRGEAREFARALLDGTHLDVPLSMDKRASNLRVDAESTPQVVVITGASAGVGRATAIRFARDGASVVLIARGEAGLEGARRDVEAAGGRALVCSADVADPWAVDAAAAHAEAELGPIDVWINCAMVTVFGEFEHLTMDEFRRVTEVTYLGYVHGTHAALQRMVPRDAGTIVQVGSALASHGIPLQSAYCGAKHAIRGFTDSVRTELMHRGSRVWLTEVHMPALNTPQFEWCKNKIGAPLAAGATDL